jgi:hypothetical protein
LEDLGSVSFVTRCWSNCWVHLMAVVRFEKIPTCELSKSVEKWRFGAFLGLWQALQGLIKTALRAFQAHLALLRLARRMPLCVPRQVQSNDWVTVKQDAHFLIQKHTPRSPSAQSIRFRKGSPTPATNGLDSSKTPGTFRIIMRCNKLCLGEFTDRSELANQWRFLHPTESDLAFDPTGHDTMQHLWQEQMVSLQTHATEQSEQAFVCPSLELVWRRIHSMASCLPLKHFSLYSSILQSQVLTYSVLLRGFSASNHLTWPQS